MSGRWVLMAGALLALGWFGAGCNRVDSAGEQQGGQAEPDPDSVDAAWGSYFGAAVNPGQAVKSPFGGDKGVLRAAPAGAPAGTPDAMGA